MSKNREITQLAEEIMIDITNSRLPLHNILLKASRLSLLLDMPENVNIFKQWAEFAEQNQFVVETYSTNVEAAKDREVSISSANPSQYVIGPVGNVFERQRLKEEAQKTVKFLSQYRTGTYNFVLGVYTKWQFGNIAESIFEDTVTSIMQILKRV